MDDNTKEIKEITTVDEPAYRGAARQKFMDNVARTKEVLNELKKRDDINVGIKKQDIYYIVFGLLFLAADEDTYTRLSKELEKIADNIKKRQLS